MHFFPKQGFPFKKLRLLARTWLRPRAPLHFFGSHPALCDRLMTISRSNSHLGLIPAARSRETLKLSDNTQKAPALVSAHDSPPHQDIGLNEFIYDSDAFEDSQVHG